MTSFDRALEALEAAERRAGEHDLTPYEYAEEIAATGLLELNEAQAVMYALIMAEKYAEEE